MDRRITKTKRAIQDAYFSLLLAKNAPKITISEIARRADIDRKTFYLHYDSIEGIIVEFSEDLIEKLLLTLEQKEFFKQPFDVACIFDSINLIINEDIVFFRKIASNPDYFFLWNEIKKILIQTFIDVYSPQVNIPIDEFQLHAEYFASGIISVYLYWLKEELPLSIDDLAKTTSTASYFGLSNIFSPRNE